MTTAPVGDPPAGRRAANYIHASSSAERARRQPAGASLRLCSNGMLRIVAERGSWPPRNYSDPVADDWEIADDEMDSWLKEWAAVDQAADDYLAERVAGVREVLADDDARWVAAR